MRDVLNLGSLTLQMFLLFSLLQHWFFSCEKEGEGDDSDLVVSASVTGTTTTSSTSTSTTTTASASTSTTKDSVSVSSATVSALDTVAVGLVYTLLALITLWRLRRKISITYATTQLPTSPHKNVYCTNVRISCEGKPRKGLRKIWVNNTAPPPPLFCEAVSYEYVIRKFSNNKN